MERKYENASSETLSDAVRMAVLRATRRGEAQEHSHLNARRLKCAQDVKEEVPTYVNAKQASVAEGEPMAVDGVQEKGKPAKKVERGRRWGGPAVGRARQNDRGQRHQKGAEPLEWRAALFRRMGGGGRVRASGPGVF